MGATAASAHGSRRQHKAAGPRVPAAEAGAGKLKIDVSTLALENARSRVAGGRQFVNLTSVNKNHRLSATLKKFGIAKDELGFKVLRD